MCRTWVLTAAAARRAILAGNLPADAASDTLLDETATAIDSLSGAQMREVAFLAMQRAILREACRAEGHVLLAISENDKV